jgi:hypothetical protein
MNFIQRIFARLFAPLLATLREEIREEITARFEQTAREMDLMVRQSDLKVRQDMRAEFIRAGKAIGEIQDRVPFTTQSPDNLSSLGDRLTTLERVLTAATEPRKPGNFITPNHEFGNKIRW